MKKMLLAILLVTVIVTGAAFTVVQESPFGELLYRYGFIAGDGSGLNAFGELKHSEIISILVSLEPELFKTFKAPTQPSFADVPVKHWAYKKIEFAYAMKLTAGKGGGLFGVNDEVTYNQASLFFAKRLGMDLTDVKYDAAAEQIGKKYGLKLKNDVEGKTALYRDQVFELYAKALYLAAVEGRALLVSYGFEADAIDAYIKDFDLANKAWNGQ